MNCTDFEREQIERIGDRGRELSDAARGHVATCADCRRAWQADRTLDGMIAAWRGSLPATTVGDRVLAAMRGDRPRRADAARPAASIPWALVAAVGVMLCLGLALWRDSDVDRQAVVQQDHDEALPITDSVVSLWDGVQTRSQQAAVETVRRLDEFPQVAMHEAIPVPASPEAAEPTTLARPWLEWGEPLGRQVGQAFRFLGDALPDPNDRPAG